MSGFTLDGGSAPEPETMTLGLTPRDLSADDQAEFPGLSSDAGKIAGALGERAARADREDDDQAQAHWSAKARELRAAAILLSDENPRLDPDGKRAAARLVRRWNEENAR